MGEQHIKSLNELGMIDLSDPHYQKPDPLKEEASWMTTLEALRKNSNPKAQALYMKMLKKYNLSPPTDIDTK